MAAGLTRRQSNDCALTRRRSSSWLAMLTRVSQARTTALGKRQLPLTAAARQPDTLQSRLAPG